MEVYELIELAHRARESAERALREEAFWLRMASEGGERCDATQRSARNLTPA